MADAIVGVLVANLKSIIQRENGFGQGVAVKMKRLHSILTTIQAVLEDAESKKMDNKPIENWLAKLEDASSEATKLLEEWANNSSSSCFNLKQLHFRRTIAKKTKMLITRFDDIAEERLKLNLDENVVLTVLQLEESRESGSILEAAVVYGRDDDKESVIQTLCNNMGSGEDLFVLPIIGMGGLGKTTLAQWVYNDHRVSSHFEKKIWVCVSENFEVKGIMKMMLESLNKEPCNLQHLDAIVSQLEEKLMAKKFLLVLDDVWNEDAAKWMKLKSVLKRCGAPQGSSILVTTRENGVASIMGSVPSYSLKRLTQKESWVLFKDCAFGKGKEEVADLVNIGKEIVKKCVGVPLAVKSLGRLVGSKKTVEEWKLVRDSKIWELKEGKSGILPALKLCFQNEEKEWLSIKDSPSSSSSAGRCICRVPKKFRKINEYAYTPELISIGPFHRKKELKGMEVHKLRYVNSLLSRFEDRATKLEECVEAISRLEDEARKCYSEPIELNKEEFVEMMIVDGLFIIELFRKNAGEGQIDKDDPVFNNVWVLASLVRDLILLENQLPMLILERLFNITMASQQGGKRLSELAILFFNPLMQREETVLAKYFETGGDHLLDILTKTFYDFPSQQLPHGVKSVQVPAPSVLMKREEIVVERAPSQGEISTSSMVKSEPELEFKDVPSLTELRESGVKFKKGNNTFSFLNINFCNGVIEIPPILIRDQNFSFIRNVIAYEQGLVGHPAQMTSYVVLMNNLIQTSNDVAFLREHGIIRNYLSDDELVSSQFQKLHNEINLANFHHSKLRIDVNAFCVTYIQKATSVLKNVYRTVVPTRWVLLAAGLFLTFDAFKLSLATTECTPDLYIFNWQRLDFLSHVLLGIILIVMFWCDSH